MSEEYDDINLTCVQWIGDFCSTESNIHRFGKLAIGTSQVKSGYQLAVKGGLLSDEIYVELCSTRGWCDYVFEDNYNRMKLDSLKKYVSKEYHLPGMISQTEIETEGGIELKKISLQQQEKIEELFLYLIDANEKVNGLKERIAAVELENNRLNTKK